MHRRRPTSPVLDPLWLQPVPAGSRRVRSRRADGRGLVAYGTWYCELGSELGTSAPCPWCMYPRPMRPRVLVRHLSEGSHSSYSSAHLHHASYTAGGPFVCLAPVPTPAPSCSPPPHTQRNCARYQGRPRCVWTTRGRFGRGRAGARIAFGAICGSLARASTGYQDPCRLSPHSCGNGTCPKYPSCELKGGVGGIFPEFVSWGRRHP